MDIKLFTVLLISWLKSFHRVKYEPRNKEIVIVPDDDQEITDEDGECTKDYVKPVFIPNNTNLRNLR